MGCLLVAMSFSAHAQTNDQPAGRGEYALVAYIGGGMGYYATNAGAPSFANTVNRWGHAATIRILWHPDHLLRVGFETGHMTFYSYKLKDSAGNTGRTELTGVPLLLVTSMPVTKRLNIFFGTGFTSVSTNLDYKGHTNSSKLSVSWMLAASYIQPLSEKLGIGTELKWMDAAETADASVVAQIQLVWKFLKW
ncbi:MAG: hypothetical protein JWQ78_1335 [Sediminibacterium sp.]|nr:hypothetical protein [Sediminibacterium sp.]